MVHYARLSGSDATNPPAFPRFEIHAERCPQVLARILGLFAAQGLIPTEFHARQSCGGLWVYLHVDVPPERAERLAEKLRAMVSVDAVLLIQIPAAEIGHKQPEGFCDIASEGLCRYWLRIRECAPSSILR
jgi:hypothetical protein